MSHKKHFLSALVFAAFLVPTLAQAQAKFEVVPSKSSVTFTISTTFNEIEGKAKTFKGSIDVPSAPTDLATGATATLSIDATSLETGNKGRDKDMHNDVLESAKYGEIKLVIKKITADSTLYAYKITADLTMHGVTKSVDFKSSVLSFPSNGKTALSISGKVKINISNWGMTPPSIVVNKVSSDVTINWSLIAQEQ